MTTFFTSDHHFGHRNILRYCSRPFDHVDQMDEELIARWNATIGDDDEVYHLGDFTLKTRGFARRIFARLRGHIRVLGLPWHHDNGWVPATAGPSSFTTASGHVVEILPALLAMKLEDASGTPRIITLSHYPLAEWEAGHHGGWHLHGHSHGQHRGPGSKLDVGVDCHDYTPVSLEQLADRVPPPTSPGPRT